MVRAYITSAVAGAFLLGMATAALAVTGEYGNMCTMGLATRQRHTDRLLHQCAASRQDLLLRQQGGHDRVHEGPLRAISPRRRPTTRRSIPGKLELLTMQEGPFHLGEGPFCYSWHQCTG